MEMLSIMDKLNDLGDKIKDFMLKQDGNVIFWVLLFLGGIAIFGIVYQALQKEKG